MVIDICRVVKKIITILIVKEIKEKLRMLFLINSSSYFINLYLSILRDFSGSVIVNSCLYTPVLVLTRKPQLYQAGTEGGGGLQVSDKPFQC